MYDSIIYSNIGRSHNPLLPYNIKAAPMKNITVRLRLLVLVVIIGLFVSLATVFSPVSPKAQYSGNENHLITLTRR